MGSVANKYRVDEVAKDFGVATKDVTEILTKYAETPKNHMQVLEDRELSLVFEYLTQHNQIDNIITTPDIDITNVFLSESVYSDHNMLVADLDI